MKEYTVKVYENRTEWYLNGKCHREDGPAVEWSNGDKYWFLNGELHREDGPAVEYSDGTKSWYLNWIQLSEAEFLNKTQIIEMTVEEISNALGKNIKIIKNN
jgi:hypothetical protein